MRYWKPQITEWVRRFAWLPVQVYSTNGHHVVWLEHVTTRRVGVVREYAL